MKLVGNKIFEKFIYALIVVNLLAMVLESDEGFKEITNDYLIIFEYFSITIFSFEYIIRTINSIKEKKGYNKSFYGIVDILAILPFYFQSLIGFDGRFIRVIRLFRVFRILKLGKFNRSFQLLAEGIFNVRRELYLTFFIAFILLFFSATGIYYLENPVQPEKFASIMDSFWWSVSSLTGVYFEEIFVVTIGGKIFGTIISLIGVGVVAVPTGIISASFVELINKDKSDGKI